MNYRTIRPIAVSIRSFTQLYNTSSSTLLNSAQRSLWSLPAIPVRCYGQMGVKFNRINAQDLACSQELKALGKNGHYELIVKLLSSLDRRHQFNLNHLHLKTAMKSLHKHEFYQQVVDLSIYAQQHLPEKLIHHHPEIIALVTKSRYKLHDCGVVQGIVEEQRSGHDHQQLVLKTTMNELYKQKKYSKIVQMYECWLEENKIVSDSLPDSFTYSIVIRALGKLGKTDELRSFWKQIDPHLSSYSKHESLHVYTTVLEVWTQNHLFDEAHSIVEQMPLLKSKDYRLNSAMVKHFYQTVMRLHLRSGHDIRCIQLWNDLKDQNHHGQHLNSNLSNSVIKAFSRLGRLDEALDVMDFQNSKCDEQSSPTTMMSPESALAHLQVYLKLRRYSKVKEILTSVAAMKNMKRNQLLKLITQLDFYNDADAESAFLSAEIQKIFVKGIQEAKLTSWRSIAVGENKACHPQIILEIDLHSYSLAAARAAVFSTMKDIVDGVKLDFDRISEFNIITGKGKGSLNQAPVLRPDIKRMFTVAFQPPVKCSIDRNNSGLIRIDPSSLRKWSKLQSKGQSCIHIR